MKKHKFVFAVVLSCFVFFVVIFRLGTIVRFDDLIDFQKPIECIASPESITSYNDFRSRIFVYNPTPEIEENLRKIFFSQKSNSEVGISTWTIPALESMARGISFEDKSQLYSRIVADNYSFQGDIGEVASSLAQDYLAQGDLKRAYSCLMEAFQARGTPSVYRIGYFFEDLLVATNEFLSCENDLKAIKSIADALARSKRLAQENVKGTSTSYFKLRLYFFDFLQFRCQTMLGSKAETEELRGNLIRELSYLLRLNRLSFLLGLKKTLHFDDELLLRRMLKFVEGNGPMTSPSLLLRHGKYVQRSSYLAAFWKFLLFQDVSPIFEPL